MSVFFFNIKNRDSPLVMVLSDLNQVITSKLLKAVQIENQFAFETAFPRPKNIIENILTSCCSALSFRLVKNFKHFLNEICRFYFRKKKLISDFDCLAQSAGSLKKINYKELFDMNWKLNFNLHQMISDLLSKSKQKNSLVIQDSFISQNDNIYYLKSPKYEVLLIFFQNEFNEKKMIYVSVLKIQKLLKLNLEKIEEDFLHCLILPTGTSSLKLENNLSGQCRHQDNNCKQMEETIKFKLLNSLQSNSDNCLSIIRELM